MTTTLARRSLLGAGMSLVLAGAGRAQAATLVSFQLSWIKSIQYGGLFAAIENGTFKDAGLEPTFVSGGPTIEAGHPSPASWSEETL